MTARRPPLDWTARLLTLGVAASVLASAWLGYRAVRGWRDSARLLAEQRATESADRLATVLARDMRGVQATVLASVRGEEVATDAPDDLRAEAASAFARYPYPESFFAWRATGGAHVVFLNRSDRRPPWIGGDPPRDPFPVVLERETEVARELAARIEQDLRRGERYSIFETHLAGRRYQVVARLLYRDPLREQGAGAVGFTVNLGWVREHYFPGVTAQVGRMTASGVALPLGVIDAAGRRVAGLPEALAAPVRRRGFLLAFFDPDLVAAHPPADLPRESWVAVAGAGGDAVLLDAVRAGNWTLVLAGAATAVFGLGLGMTVRAMRAGARLAQLRSEFVSTVTHELKTPITTIRAAGDTLARGRVSNPDALREYVQLVAQEARRLGRLVDNLLAYSRIADVTEAYSLEDVDVPSLIDEVVAGFRVPLDAAGFAVTLHLAPGLPPVRGDRTACRLLLDNLVDNAVRYSPVERCLDLRATAGAAFVTIEVADRGTGIPADEIPHVSRKFYRGRRAARGGSGLGLAIAARIVGDHGGTMRIESEVGKGTTVSVSLPAGAGDEEANPGR